MRLIRGLEAAKQALCERRGLDFDVPPEVLRHTAQALGQELSAVEAVELIIADVRRRGDAAVREITAAIDGSAPACLEVSAADIAAAYDDVPAEVVEALKMAADRVRRFHEASAPRGWHDEMEGYGQVVNAVERVGAYVPGGTARYPSTILMTTVPARVAGVDEIVVCTPAGNDGAPSPVVLVAADVAGVDRVYGIGGAQAVAAMAYGTETVPKVDVICGPGNVFVTLAKKLVYGDVGIDGLYGPTETVVIADESANPTLCAADLLAQAEHDELATPVLITTSEELAGAVVREIEVRLERLDRKSIAGEAIRGRGAIALVDDLDEAFELSNLFAPEHVSLVVSQPRSYLDRVRNAGAVFLGEFSHEVLGDYVAGPSHVMPTGGTARFGSGIGVHSFVKISPVVAVDEAASQALSGAASLVARAEGLTAHAEAAEVRDELLSGRAAGVGSSGGRPVGEGGA
jgi:histidinol dehydrogenase